MLASSPVESPSQAKKIVSNDSTVISVDAMGGDRGIGAVIKGLGIAVRKNPNIKFVVHGDQTRLGRRIGRIRRLRDRCVIQHAGNVISMSERPSHAVRHAKGSSMWSCIESVRTGEANVAVSCGNTGALMALSVLSLKRAPGVNRPAIACLWPSTNPSGFNVLLDVGADIKADETDLVCYAILGAAYARVGLGLTKPRIGLLNVGTEAHKGRSEIRTANQMIPQCASEHQFEYVGFVEGSDIPSSNVDVVVTDGFTGNAALKSVEGTAALIRQFLREAFRHSPLSRIGGIFAYTSIRRLFKRIDPRRVNGGVFLGLNGTVVKSHGGSDPVAVAAAIKLAVRLAGSEVTENLMNEVVTQKNYDTVESSGKNKQSLIA